MADEPLKVCPECEGKLTKVIYPTGVVFKGSGFYTTDYKASGKESSGKDKESSGKESSGNGAAPGTDKKPETKSESKSEPKPESKSESKPASSD